MQCHPQKEKCPCLYTYNICTQIWISRMISVLLSLVLSLSITAVCSSKCVNYQMFAVMLEYYNLLSWTRVVSLFCDLLACFPLQVIQLCCWIDNTPPVIAYRTSWGLFSPGTAWTKISNGLCRRGAPFANLVPNPRLMSIRNLNLRRYCVRVRV